MADLAFDSFNQQALTSPISLALSPPDHGALPGPSGDRRGGEGHGTSSGTRRPQFKLWLQNQLCPWAGLNITFPGAFLPYRIGPAVPCR